MWMVGTVTEGAKPARLSTNIMVIATSLKPHTFGGGVAAWFKPQAEVLTELTAWDLSPGLTVQSVR